MKALLEAIKHNQVSYPYIVIHRYLSVDLTEVVSRESWESLRRRDFIELIAHGSLSKPTIVNNAQALIDCYIKYNPDYLFPWGKLERFELRLTQHHSVNFSASGRQQSQY
ncbi:hypothetical protein [Vibrio astriarenae]|uniref:hypothetical protein n=1 Tax=Vibrio astriarenae TaxID=1481923 RepID=UPI003736E308